MTWLLGLTAACLILLLGFQLVLLWLLWSHLQVLQHLQRALQAWDRPALIAQPQAEPGTSWAPSDAELAALEKSLNQDSLMRTPSRRLRGG